jgi:uncharacterized membrane protein
LIEKEKTMSHGLYLLGGMGVGAGLMYLLDPVLGSRRRALWSGQARRAWHDLEDAACVTARDVSNRSYGLWAESSSLFSSDDASDDVIAARVRSQFGRVVSHPHALHVEVHDGRVTLSGPVLSHEVGSLLAQVGRVRGVKSVENLLDVHKQAGNIAALQGGRRRRGQRMELAQGNWSPGARLLAGAAGGALVACGLKQRFPASCILGTVGLGLLSRAATNLEMKRLLGLGAGRRAVEVQKTINIAASPDRVFQAWAQYSNFPKFMSHVKEVRDLAGGRSRWVVNGPGGVPVSWNALITCYVADELLAWKSEPGSIIANAGIVRFEPSERGTRVTIRLCYNPPGGALGHFAAMLFGADPKSAMDDDLVRFKSLIETGKASAPGKQVIAEPARERPETAEPAVELAPVL